MNPTGSAVPMGCLIPSKTPLKHKNMFFLVLGARACPPPYPPLSPPLIPRWPAHVPRMATLPRVALGGTHSRGGSHSPTCGMMRTPSPPFSHNGACGVVGLLRALWHTHLARLHKPLLHKPLPEAAPSLPCMGEFPSLLLPTCGPWKPTQRAWAHLPHAPPCAAVRAAARSAT